MKTIVRLIYNANISTITPLSTKKTKLSKISETKTQYGESPHIIKYLSQNKERSLIPSYFVQSEVL